MLKENITHLSWKQSKLPYPPIKVNVKELVPTVDNRLLNTSIPPPKEFSVSVFYFGEVQTIKGKQVFAFNEQYDSHAGKKRCLIRSMEKKVTEPIGTLFIFLISIGCMFFEDCLQMGF